MHFTVGSVSLLPCEKASSLRRHPNIESLYTYAFSDEFRRSCYLVYEIAEKGSLNSFLDGDLGRERISLFRRRVQIALDVITAVQFLHNGNDQVSSCFHCDIKASNIMLKRDFTAQLTDCGLSEFVGDRNESQSKTDLIHWTAGSLFPKYGSGVISFQRSWDIFSFGVVLSELLTGRAQDHENTNFTVQDIINNPDPTFGYDRLALPEYVRDFADLTICCTQFNPKDRPDGEAVMLKLGEIQSQCYSRTKDAAKCKLCRTFFPVSPQNVCALCKSAEERRARMSFGGLAAINDKLHATCPLLAPVDARLNNFVPRHFVIMPLCIKSGTKDPKAWLCSHHRSRYLLYFVCVHSMKAIEPPVSITVTKCWLEKVAPVHAMSLHVLLLGLKPGDCLQLAFREASVTLKLNSTKLAEILEAMSESLTETGSSDLLGRLRRNEDFDVEDIRQLNGDAYELIVEMAGEESGWREHMEPVRMKGSHQVFWVSRDVAYDKSNGYEIVQL